jgi:hypothetical protein
MACDSDTDDVCVRERVSDASSAWHWYCRGDDRQLGGRGSVPGVALHADVQLVELGDSSVCAFRTDDY